MPRPRKPARLYLHPVERTWLIRDGAFTGRTGCSEADRDGAEAALAQYVAGKFQPAARESSPARLSVAEVLAAYGREYAPSTRAPARIGAAIIALLPYWGDKLLSDVRGGTCRDYMATRLAMPRMTSTKTAMSRDRTVSIGTVRRELGTLSAAINYWHREHGPLDSVPVVSLPQKPEPKPDVLDRSQMARLLAGALGWYQLSWSDIASRQVSTKWKRDREGINRHTARFIVIGRYTANRPGATMGLCWMPNTVGGWPELDRQILFRKGTGMTESKKRQPLVRLGRVAVAHFRRWQAIDDRAREEARRAGAGASAFMRIVHYSGRPIADIGRSFASALDYAGLPRHLTPHVLRHTRVTWWVESGLSLEEVADAAGMTVDMVEQVYWHRSPHFQKRAAEA